MTSIVLLGSLVEPRPIVLNSFHRMVSHHAQSPQQGRHASAPCSAGWNVNMFGSINKTW
eukprot:c40043_g1_i1 orf=153-329(-)